MEEELRGCYLLDAEQPPDDDNDWPNFTDPVQKIFVYATENEFLEFMSNDTPDIEKNVKYDDEGYKVFDVHRYHNVDAARIVFSNKEKRQAKYSNMRFLFNGEEFDSLFNSSAGVESIYMQCQLAQHCRWNQEQSMDLQYAECLEAAIEFEESGGKYPGYDEKFRMPTPEDIEILKKQLGIKDEDQV